MLDIIVIVMIRLVDIFGSRMVLYIVGSLK